MRLSWGLGVSVGLSLVGAFLLSGCGGSGSAVGNSSTAYIRSVDAAVAAGTADVLINGAATYGDQTYFDSDNNTATTPYEYIGPQNGVSLSYNLPNETLPDSAVAVTNYNNVSSGNYYTAVLIGSFNANYSTTPADPRILQTILLPARASSTSGAATLRVLNAAPDAGFNSTTYAAGSVNVVVGANGGTTAPAAFNSILYGTATNYQTLPAGTNVPVTVTITGASSGTAAVTTGTINLSAGQVYTLFVAENSSTPTYQLQLVQD